MQNKAPETCPHGVRRPWACHECNRAWEIGKIIHDAAQAYEFRGDNGDYTPTDAERAMLDDFGNSLLSDLCRAPARLSQPGNHESGLPRRID